MSSLRIDGAVDNEYTHLTEAGFAGPYAGGSTNTSDYIGESAAYRAQNAGSDLSRNRQRLSGYARAGGKK